MHPPPAEPETPAFLVESPGPGPPREMTSQVSTGGEPRPSVGSSRSTVS